ncbi:RecQ mediated genome instability protein-like protein Rmi1 [Tothia fuscella]|uniref:RecQ-mediated genome instability protein 1 n=1 Tax=Tothia fuscella TaxID=1048955 RepID=A0A9P4NWX1_9PEZI|nr:RecQ mediated genome instability protein-like protein Rmi1 [Tothia fuscella]
MSSSNLASEILSHLQSKGLNPNPTWVTNFLSSQRPSVPLQALKQTAQIRLTHADITTSLQRSSKSVFPADIHNASVRERKVVGPIVVQVLDIEDIGRSKWSQLEALEAEERGETTKGREIIRVVPGEATESDNQAPVQSNGPHKLTLQDAQGTSVYGMEIVNVEGVGMSMNIGSKLVLKDVVVARGVLLLEPRCVVVLGGKIEELHKVWKEKRKETLKLGAQQIPPTSGPR